MVHLFTHLNLCTLMSESKREFQKYTRAFFSSFDFGPDQAPCEINGQQEALTETSFLIWKCDAI